MVKLGEFVMKKNYVQLLVILVVSFGLRLIALNQSLWLDEAIEWWGVTAFNLRELLTGYMLGDFNPPSHHLLMWVWVRIFGDSEIALRFPSVLFGVGTVWMVYAIARATSDRLQVTSSAESSEKKVRPANFLRTVLGEFQGPSFVGLLAATNGLLIYYSQEARMYAMATFFVTASVWAFLKLQKFFSIQMLTTYYLLLTAALYSHYLAWLMIPVFVMGGVRNVREMRGLGIVRRIKYAIPLLLTLPLWPLLAGQLQNGIASAGNSQWAMLSQTTPKNVALVFVKFVTGRVPFPDDFIWQLVVGVVVMLFWVGVVRGVREMWRVRERRIVIYWLVVPLVLGGLIGLVIPVFSYFRFLFVLPAALLLFGRGITVRKMRKMREMRVMGGMGVTVFLSFSLLYLLVPSNHRENWRDAVASIYSPGQWGIVIIHPAVRPPFDYYDRGRSTVISPFSREFASFADPVWDRGWSAWNFRYGQPIFDPEDSVRQRFQKAGFTRDSERHFRGVTAERWSWSSELEYESEKHLQ